MFKEIKEDNFSTEGDENASRRNLSLDPKLQFYYKFGFKESILFSVSF